MPRFFLFCIQPYKKFRYVFQQKMPQYIIHQNWSMTNQVFGHTGVGCPSWQICVCHFSSEPFCQNSFSKSLKHKVSYLSDIVSEIPFLLSITDYPSRTTPLLCNSSDFTQDSVWKCKSTIYPLDTLDRKQGNSSPGVNKTCWFITSSRCRLSCRSMCLHWATCILHWSSKVNTLILKISLRTPDLTQGSEKFPSTAQQKEVRLLKVQRAIQQQCPCKWKKVLEYREI